jgi:hypothetical protein
MDWKQLKQQPKGWNTILKSNKILGQSTAGTCDGAFGSKTL